ncbi:hypothetical protein BDW59DRAFT_31663 [Aspergillus cavernicola]|uniref:Transcription elongation factor 1 homolog n=1 Tax=Aspergillus cavernicola TaxID=176166 RepID=A0ABR4HCX7_9EURO
MGKRKKSSRQPQQPRKKEPLPSTFACLFCNHENSIVVKLDKKLGLGHLSCKVCGQRFQTGINCKLRAPSTIFIALTAIHSQTFLLPWTYTRTGLMLVTQLLRIPQINMKKVMLTPFVLIIVTFLQMIGVSIMRSQPLNMPRTDGVAAETRNGVQNEGHVNFQVIYNNIFRSSIALSTTLIWLDMYNSMTASIAALTL